MEASLQLAHQTEPPEAHESALTMPRVLAASNTASSFPQKSILHDFSMAGRVFGIVYGFGNQILFLVTVWYLFWFLRDGATDASHSNWVLRDCGLAILFAFSHSVMLVPKTRKHLTQWIPQPFYDSTFCVVTCVSLLMLFFGWRSSQTTLWQATVYLSFLGLVWFTPVMTLDHAALTAIWTGYIFYGSCLKDRRLEHYIGQPYKDYERRVPGYPLVSRGPLSRRVS